MTSQSTKEFLALFDEQHIKNTLADYLSIFSMLLFLFSCIITFPVYIFTFQCTKQKEKILPIYPFIRHFFRFSIFIEIIFLISSFFVFIEYLWSKLVLERIPAPTDEELSTPFNMFFRILPFFLMLFLGTSFLTKTLGRLCVCVISCIFFFLALQRFLLYHFGRKARWRFAKVISTPWTHIITLLYFVNFVVQLVIPLALLFLESFASVQIEIVMYYETISWYVSYFSLFCATTMYCSISLHIHKISKAIVGSNSFTNANYSRYILVQTIITFLSKTIILLYSLLSDFHKIGDNEVYNLELLITPLTIHLSYILSCGRNFRIARNIDFDWKTFMIMLGKREVEEREIYIISRTSLL